MKTKSVYTVFVIGMLILITGFFVKLITANVNIVDNFSFNQYSINDNNTNNASNIIVGQTFILYGQDYFDVSNVSVYVDYASFTATTLYCRIYTFNETNKKAETLINSGNTSISYINDTWVNINFDNKTKLGCNITYIITFRFTRYIHYGCNNLNVIGNGEMYYTILITSAFNPITSHDLSFDLNSIGVSMIVSNPIDTSSSYGWENITATISGSSVVDDCHLIITFPDWSVYNFSMSLYSYGIYYYNTTYTSYGTYNYYVWVHCSDGIQDASDNYFYYKPPNWDINIDGITSIWDAGLISNNWGKTGVNGWIRSDINNDGIVSIWDIGLVSNHWGEQWNVTGIPSPFGMGNNYRMVSIPYNGTLSKTLVNVTNGINFYSWNDAVSNNIIQTNLYGWSTSGYYELKTSFEAYKGYFMYFYDTSYYLILNETVTNYNFNVIENIINCTGNYQYQFLNSTGFVNLTIWNNYTGNNTGCTFPFFLNYSDENITINVSVNGCENVLLDNSSVNETNYINTMGSILFDDNQFMTIILLIIGIQMILYGLKDDKKSGGFCVIFGGFSLLGVAIVSFTYISVIGGIFLLFAVYFILTGINKTFFKKKGETTETKKTG